MDSDTASKPTKMCNKRPLEESEEIPDTRPAYKRPHKAPPAGGYTSIPESPGMEIEVSMEDQTQTDGNGYCNSILKWEFKSHSLALWIGLFPISKPWVRSTQGFSHSLAHGPWFFPSTCTLQNTCKKHKFNKFQKIKHSNIH